MQFLLLAILCSSSVSIAMRIGTDRAKYKYGMLTMNYVACMLLAALHTGFRNLFPIAEGFTVTLGLGAFTGLIYLVAFVLMQSNVEKNGVVLASVFMKLGLLVPMLVSVLFFGEMPGVLQILGFVLALAAIVMINWKSGGSSASSGLSLILLLLAGGSADCMSKVFEELGRVELSNQFLFFTFFFAFVLCCVLMLFKGQRIGKSEIIYGCLIGLPNFYSSKCILLALERLDAVIVYPSFSVGTLLVVTLTGVLFFREKLRSLQWLAVAIILVSLVMLNV